MLAGTVHLPLYPWSCSSGWGLKKQRSAPSYRPMRLAKTLLLYLWHTVLMRLSYVRHCCVVFCRRQIIGINQNDIPNLAEVSLHIIFPHYTSVINEITRS